MSLAHRVFVSHATEDLDTASRICKILEGDGIGCWLASRDVKAGTDYAAAILEAIRSSDLVLLIFSSDANTSPYVLREIERAIAYDRPVLSLRIDDAVPNPSMEYYLNLWQWLDAAGGIEKNRGPIIAAVRRQLGGTVNGTSGWDLGETLPSTRRQLPEPAARKEAASAGKRIGRAWKVALAAFVLVAAGTGGGTWAAMSHGSAPGGPSTTLASSAAATTSTRGAAASSNTAAQKHNTWTSVTPIGSIPRARYGPSMVYDPSSRRVIMFGGGHDIAEMNDTWAYETGTNTWTDLKPSGKLPPARDGSTMVYDPSSHRVIMFGGGGFNDTWAYDTAVNAWTDLQPSGTLPSARNGQSMVYDPSSHRVIVFGGQYGTTLDNDTWAYDPAANTWIELHPGGEAAPARAYASMAYDPSTHRVIVFGGLDGQAIYNDTWAYDPAGNTWTNLSPMGTLPHSRYGQSMIYDPSRGRVVMFGGSIGADCVNDTWAYDPAGNNWTQLYPGGDLPPSSQYQSMTYDPSTFQVIMFGGWVDGIPRDGTWRYTP